MDELLGEFLTETGENLDLLDQELVRFEQDPNNAEMLNSIFRLVHTIKGTCGFLGLKRLATLAHAAETLMGQYRDGAQVTVEGVTVILASIDRIKQILAGLEQTGSEPPGMDDDLVAELEGLALAQASTHRSPIHRPTEAVVQEDEGRVLSQGEVTLDELERAWLAAPGPDLEYQDKPHADGNSGKELHARAQTLRVSVDTLEHLMTTVSELVLTRNQLLDLVRKNGDSDFKTPLQRLSNVTAELQDGIMKARMQPIANAWQKLPRLVRDLSHELDKTIEIDLAGGDTELDRQVLELIKDPLTHMIRNSADHGIESAAARVRAGKPPAGKIKLSAGQRGGYIVIEVSDDGRGLDAQKIRAKALATGLATQAEINRLSDADTYKFIFRPGFSTASAVTGISGRGVGMDVVRANIELIGGTVELKSTSHKGTSFLIKIPLTLAIMAALIVEVGGQRFAIPQYSVVELVRSGRGSEHHVERINETTVLRLRDKLVPLLDLRQLLRLESGDAIPTRDATKAMIVVVMQIGARVFGVLVDGVFHTEEIVVKPMSSLLRDVGMFSGNTILGDGSVIMIIDPNALGAAVGTVELPGEGSDEAAKAVEQEQESATALLLFRAGTRVLKAVPLSLITRLEEIDVNDIEHCKGEDLVQYRGALMPLVHVADAHVREQGVQPVLVFTEGGRPIGLAIDEIVDIVEEPLTIEITTDEPGVIGAAIIKGRATEIVDVSHYLAKGIGKRLTDATDRLERDIRLLLVDDSQFFRNMLAPLLAASGYRVTVAASGDEALALKDKGETFDLIVSDLEMPEMDGIAFAECLKGDRQWGKIPLIALSSYGTPRLVERTRAAGFINHIGKFDRKKLMDTLAACRKEWGTAA